MMKSYANVTTSYQREPKAAEYVGPISFSLSMPPDILRNSAAAVTIPSHYLPPNQALLTLLTRCTRKNMRRYIVDSR